MSAPNAHSHDSSRFGQGGVVRRWAGLGASGIDHLDAPQDDPHAVLDSLLTPEFVDELVERVADKLEERVIVELERRGRRALPEVF
jgi:hypothetical protein